MLANVGTKRLARRKLARFAVIFFNSLHPQWRHDYDHLRHICTPETFPELSPSFDHSEYEEEETDDSGSDADDDHDQDFVPPLSPHQPTRHHLHHLFTLIPLLPPQYPQPVPFRSNEQRIEWPRFSNNLRHGLQLWKSSWRTIAPDTPAARKTKLRRF